MSLYPLQSSQHFNSLPHAEVDHLLLQSEQLHLYFNSLPHAEVDAY